MIETQRVEKYLYSNYLKKADEYFKGMKDELNCKRWNLASLAAVHCAITANDSLCIFFLGEKHKGAKHSDAARLIARIKELDAKEIDEKAKQFASILTFKTPVEYDKTIFNQREAEELVKKVERFYLWAKEKLK